MGKSMTRNTIWLLIAMLLISVITVYVFNEIRKANDPFALMYEENMADRYIVKYKDGRSGLSIEDVASVSTSRVSELEYLVLSEKVNPAEFAATLKTAGMAAELEYIQPDYILFNSSYELDNIEPENKLPEPELYEKLFEEQLPPAVSDQQEVIVALIDTGVDTSHPAISNAVIDGWNFVDNTSDILYDSSNPTQSAHGTYIAGVIAANSNEYIKIMPLQVFGAYGAYTSDIIAAIAYAEEHGVKIVNCSFGNGQENRALQEAMAASDMLFVISAGNAGSDLEKSPVYPAVFGLDNTISVASLNADKGFSFYSNYSNKLVDIAARGRDVLSALPGGEFGLQSGTSIAAAYVSAAAGLVLSENLQLSAAELKERLCKTGERMAHLQNKVVDGRSLDVSRALSGNSQNDMVYINPEEDTDINGYAPTTEQWVLFGSQAVSVVIGKQYDISIYGKEVTDFNNKSTTIQYNPAELQLVDLCSFTKEKELTSGSIGALGLNITQVSPGTIVFTVNKAVPAGKAWAGILNTFKFQALKTVQAEITILSDIVAPPAPTTIAFTQTSYSANVPVSGSTTITASAQVKDQYGSVMDGLSPTYSLQSAYSGVSINATTGVVTIQSGTLSGTVTLKASYGTLTAATAPLSVIVPPPAPTTIAFVQSSYSANAPTSGSTTITVSAQIKDQYGSIMGGVSPTYSLQSAYSGVSINSTTGVVTIQSSAASGTVTLKASYGSLTAATAPLNVTNLTPVPTTVVFVQSSYSITIPKNGNEQINISAQVKDQFGNTMSGYSITYSLQSPYNGVSVNTNSAKVSVTSSAAAGTATLKASYGSLSGTAPLVLTK